MIAAPLEIGAVARELGVAPSTLRSWEHRYRTVIPKRGAHGQRLYDRDQVALLRKILAQTKRGVRAHAAHRAAGDAAPVVAARFRFEPTATAPQAARREVARLLRQGAYSERVAFDARLVTSELVKNAVLHGTGHAPIELEVEGYPGWIDLRIGDGGRRLGLKSLRSRRRPSHGIDIVDALAESWSIDSGPRGTLITVRLSTVRNDGV